MKIYALFSIANDYNQPDNNLVAWWIEKPSLQTIADCLEVLVDKDIEKSIQYLLEGLEIRLYSDGSSYQLKHISEGKLSK